jgi:hypothetical protein
MSKTLKISAGILAVVTIVASYRLFTESGRDVLHIVDHIDGSTELTEADRRLLDRGFDIEPPGEVVENGVRLRHYSKDYLAFGPFQYEVAVIIVIDDSRPGIEFVRSSSTYRWRHP